jgi:hypothetical protein
MSCCAGDASKKIFIKKKIEKDGAKWNNSRLSAPLNLMEK